MTTLARVRAMTGMAAADTSNDSMLSQFIVDVSAVLERNLCRHLQSARRTEVVGVRYPELTVALKGCPIDSLVSIKLSATKDFSAATALVTNEEFVLDDAAGTVNLLVQAEYNLDPRTGRPLHQGWLQAVYTGGMADDTTEFVTLFPDLASACDAQVRYLYQRRAALGGDIETSQGGATFDDQYKLLPHVQAILNYWRRESF